MYLWRDKQQNNNTWNEQQKTKENYLKLYLLYNYSSSFVCELL